MKTKTMARRILNLDSFSQLMQGALEGTLSHKTFSDFSPGELAQVLIMAGYASRLSLHDCFTLLRRIRNEATDAQIEAALASQIECVNMWGISRFGIMDEDGCWDPSWEFALNHRDEIDSMLYAARFVCVARGCLIDATPGVRALFAAMEKKDLTGREVKATRKQVFDCLGERAELNRDRYSWVNLLFATPVPGWKASERLRISRATPRTA